MTAYRRPNRRFGVLIMDDWDKRVHVVPEVRAHDRTHAEKLALRSVERRKENPRARLRVLNVFRGILTEA